MGILGDPEKNMSLDDIAFAMMKKRESFFKNKIVSNHVTVLISDYNPWRRILSEAYPDRLIDKGNTILIHDLILHESIINRSVYTIDCKSLCKFDAICWLENLSKMPKTPKKTIIIIENITEIPDEDDVHDSPKYVEEILIHSWKNSENSFYNPRTKDEFKIKPNDYIIFLTVPANLPKKTLDSILSPSDGYVFAGDYIDYQKAYVLSSLKRDGTLKEKIKKNNQDDIYGLYKEVVDETYRNYKVGVW